VSVLFEVNSPFLVVFDVKALTRWGVFLDFLEVLLSTSYGDVSVLFEVNSPFLVVMDVKALTR